MGGTERQFREQRDCRYKSSTSVRSGRSRAPRPASADAGSVGPAANAAAKRQSSGSATRGESELRKQLLHLTNTMDKSETSKSELEERGMLF
eukprot:s446_g23.t1